MIAKIIFALISFAWVYLSSEQIRKMKTELILLGVCRYCESISDFISKLSRDEKIFLFTYGLPGLSNLYLNSWLVFIADNIAYLINKDMDVYARALLIGQPVQVVMFALSTLLTFAILYGFYRLIIFCFWKFRI